MEHSVFIIINIPWIYRYQLKYMLWMNRGRGGYKLIKVEQGALHICIIWVGQAAPRSSRVGSEQTRCIQCICTYTCCLSHCTLWYEIPWQHILRWMHVWLYIRQEHFMCSRVRCAIVYSNDVSNVAYTVSLIRHISSENDTIMLGSFLDKWMF